VGEWLTIEDRLRRDSSRLWSLEFVDLELVAIKDLLGLIDHCSTHTAGGRASSASIVTGICLQVPVLQLGLGKY
jgi:hypothetical protein